MKQEINVQGMSCNNCVTHVTEAINELEGVKAVKVHLKKKKATIKFDESKISLDDIVNKVNTDTVYQATKD